MPKRIILIRHAETEDNKVMRFQGWTDSELTKRGHIQARMLSDRLKSEKIDALYTSDLIRTKQTAGPLAKQLNLFPNEMPEIKEHGMGIFEGLYYEKLSEKEDKLWKEFIGAMRKGEVDFKGHEGETLREFHKRVRRFIDHVKNSHNEETIAAVTHGGTINRIFEVLGLKKLSDDYLMLFNTSITILNKSKDKYEVEVINDTSHLPQK